MAIKVSREKINGGFQGELIANEVLLLSQCRHKNIVNYLEAYLFRERIWTVMEYCVHGDTLVTLASGVSMKIKDLAALPEVPSFFFISPFFNFVYFFFPLTVCRFFH